MVTMAELNARMDKGLERRAWLHRLRKAKKVDVNNYKGGLKAVRDLEDEVEPQRKALGAKHSRAIERVTVHSDGYYDDKGVSMSEQHEEGLDLAPPEPSPDPFAEVEADVSPEAEAAAAPAEGTLGGDGATLEEMESGEPINGGAEPEQGEFLEDPEAATAAEPEPEPEQATAEPEAAPAEAKAEPASEDQAAEPKADKKSGSSTRHYAVLMKNPDTGEWKEPFSEEGGIQAANGEIAMREAYSRLVPADSEDQIELVVFPTHYWKPKKVGAKAKVKRSVTIE